MCNELLTLPCDDSLCCHASSHTGGSSELRSEALDLRNEAYDVAIADAEKQAAIATAPSAKTALNEIVKKLKRERDNNSSRDSWLYSGKKQLPNFAPFYLGALCKAFENTSLLLGMPVESTPVQIYGFDASSSSNANAALHPLTPLQVSLHIQT